jgi:tRNA1Val (adenine37-N6)-methyltransferase
MSVFKFKEFSIIQEKSAMKVGTDGVLLGSWVACKQANTILDIGCGTGLISLMLAQRNLNSNIIGIEIDAIASQEAKLNVDNSDWQERIRIEHSALQQFKPETQFDLIVSNPPFFDENKAQDRRATARHTNFLSFGELIGSAENLLTEKGIFGVITSKYTETEFCEIATTHNLYCNRVCNVKGNESTEVKRVMLEFSFVKAELLTEYLTIETARNKYTNEYVQLCKDFYLKM